MKVKVYAGLFFFTLLYIACVLFLSVPSERHYRGVILWGDHDSLGVNIVEKGGKIIAFLVPMGQEGDVEIIGTTQMSAWQEGKWAVTIKGRRGDLSKYLPDYDRDEVFDAIPFSLGLVFSAKFQNEYQGKANRDSEFVRKECVR